MANLICRYCDKPIELGQEVKTMSYWFHLPFWCHAECKKDGERQEAIDCQVIDADCNDCKHFKRGQAIYKWSIAGHCLKFDKPTVAFPNKWTGRECFEHRRITPPTSPTEAA